MNFHSINVDLKSSETSQSQKLELSLGVAPTHSLVLFCIIFMSVILSEPCRMNFLTIHVSQESAKDTYPSAGPLSSNTTDWESKDFTVLLKMPSKGN